MVENSIQNSEQPDLKNLILNFITEAQRLAPDYDGESEIHSFIEQITHTAEKSGLPVREIDRAKMKGMSPIGQQTYLDIMTLEWYEEQQSIEELLDKLYFMRSLRDEFNLKDPFRTPEKP